MASAEPRIELFFKTDTELRERVRMLSSHGYQSFSLVNKNADDKMLMWVGIVLQEAPQGSVCAHYSLKYNKDKGGPDATFGRFSSHLDRMDKLGHGRQAEVLLVSGAGPKTLDAVACLEKLAHKRAGGGGSSSSSTALGVAFNPYFEDGAQAAVERERLQKKLATQQVKTVWLQFGSDTARLARSLEWLTGEMKVERIVGSLFLPNKQLIAQQRFRPWHGVFLSSDYLSGPERAEAITRDILALYARFGVEILVEAPGVKTVKDVAALRSLRLAATPGADHLQTARPRGELHTDKGAGPLCATASVVGDGARISGGKGLKAVGVQQEQGVAEAESGAGKASGGRKGPGKEEAVVDEDGARASESAEANNKRARLASGAHSNKVYM
jgi:hypothetical protein